jgi:hypothetical protein
VGILWWVDREKEGTYVAKLSGRCRLPEILPLRIRLNPQQNHGPHARAVQTRAVQSVVDDLAQSPVGRLAHDGAEGKLKGGGGAAGGVDGREGEGCIEGRVDLEDSDGGCSLLPAVECETGERSEGEGRYLVRMEASMALFTSKTFLSKSPDQAAQDSKQGAMSISRVVNLDMATRRQALSRTFLRYLFGLGSVTSAATIRMLEVPRFHQRSGA